MGHDLSIHPSVDAHLGSLYLVPIVDNAAMSKYERVFEIGNAFTSASRSGVALSCGTSVQLSGESSVFSASLHRFTPPPPAMCRVPVSPHPHQHLLSIFLVRATLVGMKQYLPVV